MSNLNIKVAQSKAIARQFVVISAILSVVMISQLAFGAGFEESAQKADTLFKNILKWGTILAGSAGAVYLLIKFMQAWNGHSDWMDFLKFAFFYACAGGVATIAAYIFGAFK